VRSRADRRPSSAARGGGALPRRRRGDGRGVRVASRDSTPPPNATRRQRPPPNRPSSICTHARPIAAVLVPRTRREQNGAVEATILRNARDAMCGGEVGVCLGGGSARRVRTQRSAIASRVALELPPHASWLQVGAFSSTVTTETQSHRANTHRTVALSWRILLHCHD